MLLTSSRVLDPARIWESIVLFGYPLTRKVGVSRMRLVLEQNFLARIFGLVFGSVGMWVSPVDVNGGRGGQVDERVVGGKGATVCSSSPLQPRVRQQSLRRGRIFHNQMSYPDGCASWQPPARHFMGAMYSV